MVDACSILQKEDGYQLDSNTVVSATVGDVFSFFSDVGNLDKLTPPFLRFEILTSTPMVMRVGTLIDYRLRVRGLPIRWQSEITLWDPPHRFVDEQRRGPYRFWKHLHEFKTVDGGTEIIDRVHYAVPGGRLMHKLFVRRDLQTIFSYRVNKLLEHFSK